MTVPSCIISRPSSRAQSTPWCFPATHCSTAARCAAAFPRRGSCTSRAMRCLRCATASVWTPRTMPRWKTLAGPSSSSLRMPSSSACRRRIMRWWAILPAGRSQASLAAKSWATRTTACRSPVRCCWRTPSTIFMRRSRSTMFCWIQMRWNGGTTITTFPTAWMRITRPLTSGMVRTISC